ncbi:hypothetical protein WNZ14_11090 [Hoeflea sp. AS60]|uniref:hypothetical protein n=1 Tax=Hoeflea sp. AS60 TaxID=3135780 RepID=UPI00317642F1
MIAKPLIHLAGASSAGIALGVQMPIMVTSRSDTIYARTSRRRWPRCFITCGGSGRWGCRLRCGNSELTCSDRSAARTRNGDPYKPRCQKPANFCAKMTGAMRADVCGSQDVSSSSCPGSLFDILGHYS